MTHSRFLSLTLLALLLTSLGAHPLFVGAAAAPPRANVAADLTAVGALASLPDTGQVRFVRSAANGHLLFAGLTDGGLRRSADGGRTWRALSIGVAGGPGAQMLDLQIAPSDSNIVWAAGLTGVYHSFDGGLTWSEADTRGDAQGRVIGSVLSVDPRHPETAYLAGYRNGGLYGTGDGGLSWRRLLPYPVSALAVDPANGALVYALSRAAGFQRSADHGHTWSTGFHLPFYGGIGQETALPGRLLALSGRYAGLYAGLDGGIILHSADGGRSWQDYSSGLPQSAGGSGLGVPFSLTLAGGTDPHLYVLLPEAAGGAALYAAMPAVGAAMAVRTLVVRGQSAGLGGALSAGLARAGGWGPAGREIALAADAASSTPSVVDAASASATPTNVLASPSASPSMALASPGTMTLTMTPSATMPASGTVLLASATRTPSPTESPTASWTLTSTATRTPAPVHSTATRTPVPTVAPAVVAPTPPWQRVATRVDAVAANPAVRLLAAVEVPPGTGYAASIGDLGGSPFLRLAGPQAGPIARAGTSGFLFGNTSVPYLSGINYEGPSDRPWQMWQDGKFDPTLIANDLDAAAAAGYRVLRIFVQDPLPAQVLAGRFGHLDTLVALAKQRDLRLLVTFNDSRDPDLTRVMAVDHAIAQHYSGSTTIFGYDLQNEPGIQDIAGAIYPPGTALPLLDPALPRRYGQHYALTRILADRRAGKWQTGSFAHMTATQVWQYLNAAAILDDYLAAANSGAGSSSRWAPLLTALNASLQIFVNLQRQAVRKVDRAHLITMGYNSLLWAGQPANSVLDFRSFHLYPTSQSFDSIHDSLRVFETLASRTATPVLLEEYGFSTAFQSAATASVQETGMSLYLRVLGGAGDVKWQLNDDTVGYNAYENGLGLFGAGNTPKVGFAVNRALAAYFSGPHLPGGVCMWPDSVAGLGYVYSAPDALGVSGGSYTDARVRYTASGRPANAQLWLDWATPGRLRLISTHDADLRLDLAALTGALPRGVTIVPNVSTARSGAVVTLRVRAGIWYTLLFAPGPRPSLSPDLPAPARRDGWYVLQTGHNVAPPFLARWLALGGLSVAGPALAEAQGTPGSSVQYYTSVALRQNGGSAVLLPLGLQENGGPDPRSKELPRTQAHQYFASTGHNLSGAFLRYWRSTGGLSTWGPPISEVKQRNGYTVQYCANAEFVLSGKSVVLGSVGARAWAALAVKGR